MSQSLRGGERIAPISGEQIYTLQVDDSKIDDSPVRISTHKYAFAYYNFMCHK